jgi:Fe-S oxidoreductase/nitrate reductase gamma subunit
MNNNQATREVLWNISHSWLIYPMFALALAVAAWGVWRRVRTWRRGLPANRFDRPQERLRLLLTHALGQRRTLREKHARFFHAAIFFGFIVLTMATTVVMVHHDFGLPLMQGWFYLVFQSFIVDVFGALVLLGVAIALWRRTKLKPKKLVYTEEAEMILLAIFAIALTGFLVEGWRIAATNEPWGAWSPFGYLVAIISKAIAPTVLLEHLHLVFWWTHAVLVFAFIAWAPYTKMIHALTGPLNIYTARLEPTGAILKTIDFEKAETLGVKTLAGFTWKDLLDFDACTECGRCTSVCPANTAGKTLSPRDLILGLRTHLHDESAIRNPQSAIVGTVNAAGPESLWACTTCGACMEACPVFIEQMPKIVDLRRFLVMEEAAFPETMADAVTSLESRGHPFKGAQAGRMDWADGLNVTTLADAATEARAADVLLWVGCGGALLERNQKVVRATAQLLEKAGVKFAVLGREEKCTGDPARRIGNEFLFEMLAKENVETLNGYAVKTIVTSCPHCFNTFRNEYPHFGGSYEVFHHSDYLARLVNEGRLKPSAVSDKTVTFHDPCYLGRHNGVFDAPRQLVQISSRNVVEMERNRAQGFCCGGGGGMSFVDEPKNQRVNQVRAQEAVDTGADVVAAGCPFCMTMLEDGVKARKGERDVQVMDVSELLWRSIGD